jgi:exodeoxyribonuclease VII small subunit
MAKKTVRFEDSLAELEQLVDRMEQGNLPLEDALALFERGVALARACQKSLQEAEQKVQILVTEAGQSELKPYNEADDT